MRGRAEPSLHAVVRVAFVLVLVLSAACARRVAFHPGGVRRSEGRTWSIGDVEHGFWSYWYPNGALREQGRYDHGRREGIWQQWYPNGTPRSRGNRVWNADARRSERDGPWILWHDNGTRLAVGVFRGGRREGHWDYSHPDGTLDGNRSGEYHDDVLVH